MTRNVSVVGAAALILVAGVCSSVFSAVPRQPEPPVVPATDKAQLDTFLSRELIRLALLDLRAITQPGPDDYQAAHVLLGLAHELDPKNPDIVRRQVEAAFNAGDQAAVLEHTRALVLLDPQDTVAQLRLITATISRRFQNADDRLTEYERYLSGDAKGMFDASIRSRLALDAALLLRERGDDKGFRQKLVQSMQLDSSHKEAASLGATVFSARSPDDTAGMLDMLVNLLKADPVDPNIHLSLARTLAANGAYSSARRFHANAMNIATVLGGVNDDMLAQSRILKWYTDGPGAMVKALDEAVAAEKDAAAREIKRLIDNKKPVASAKKPEDVRLSPQFVALSILGSEAAGDKLAATAKLKDFAETVEASNAQLKNPRTRGAMTDEQAARSVLESLIQLNTLRLWVNLEVERANDNPEAFKGIRDILPDAATILDALWALRAGKPEETIALCKDLQQERMARIATAMAHEQLGNKEQAIGIYRQVIREEPLQMSAAWARTRAMGLGFTDDAATAAAMDRLVSDSKVPAWMDELVIEPNRFLRVSAEAPGQGGVALDYLPVRLSIVNQSQIPLALGPDRPLNSRFIMLPKLERIGVENLLRPEVIDIDRRLRLMPQERLDVEVWPDPGQSGWLISTMANRSVPVRWRFVQGFLFDSNSGFRPGPMSLTAETDAFVIRPLPDSMLTADELAKAIAASPEGSIQRFAALTRSMILAPLVLAPPVKVASPLRPDAIAPKVEAPEVVKLKPVADALVARYQALGPAARAMLALVVPHARLCPDMEVFDAAARADQDPQVRCIVLCTRVVDPADDLLKAGLSSDDVRVRNLATAVAARLKTPAKLYSRMTPDDLKPPPAKVPEAGK